MIRLFEELSRDGLDEWSSLQFETGLWEVNWTLLRLSSHFLVKWDRSFKATALICFKSSFSVRGSSQQGRHRSRVLRARETGRRQPGRRRLRFGHPRALLRVRETSDRRRSLRQDRPVKRFGRRRLRPTVWRHQRYLGSQSISADAYVFMVPLVLLIM